MTQTAQVDDDLDDDDVAQFWLEYLLMVVSNDEVCTVEDLEGRLLAYGMMPPPKAYIAYVIVKNEEIFLRDPKGYRVRTDPGVPQVMGRLVLRLMSLHQDPYPMEH